MAGGARGIQSIEVSGRILKALVAAGEPMMLKGLAEAADLKPAQCHAYLTSLKNVGLVHQDWATGLYSAGSFSLSLGVSWLEANRLAAEAIRALKSLTDELGVMSLITAWGTFGPTIVHIYAGQTQGALNLRPGALFSVTGASTGRIFATYLDRPEVRAQIDSELTRKAAARALGTALTKEDFTELVADIRTNGYSVARENPIPGVNAVAVPLFGEHGLLAFAATMIGPAQKLSVEVDAPAVVRMLALTDKLSHPPAAAPRSA